MPQHVQIFSEDQENMLEIIIGILVPFSGITTPQKVQTFCEDQLYNPPENTLILLRSVVYSLTEAHSGVPFLNPESGPGSAGSVFSALNPIWLSGIF